MPVVRASRHCFQSLPEIAEALFYSFENGNVASIDGNGNIVIAGSLTQHGSAIAVTETANGAELARFSDRTSAPSIEDMGEARLLSGRAYVPLTTTFASSIDPTASYLVYITPRGASNSLFVTNVSSRGFSVVENGGGRASLAFDYRIVARPFDATRGTSEAMRAMSRVRSFKAPTAPRRSR